MALNFNEFVNEVTKNIKDFLPDTYSDYEVKIDKVTKTNDTELTGISIIPKNSVNCQTCTIYLEDYYDSYNKGEMLDSVFDAIASKFLNYNKMYGSNTDVSYIISNLENFELMKGRILPRLVNKSTNENKMKTCPFMEWSNDFIIVFQIYVGKNAEALMMLPLSNDIYAKFDINLDELYEIALENLKTLLPTRIYFDEKLPGICIGNDEKCYGATNLLDINAIKDYENKLGKCLYVPISEDRIMIAPADVKFDKKLIEMALQESNREIDPTEVLSNYIYVYDFETNSLKRAA